MQSVTEYQLHDRGTPVHHTEPFENVACSSRMVCFASKWRHGLSNLSGHANETDAVSALLFLQIGLQRKICAVVMRQRKIRFYFFS